MKPLIHSIQTLKLYCNCTSQIVISGMQDFQLGPKSLCMYKKCRGIDYSYRPDVRLNVEVG